MELIGPLPNNYGEFVEKAVMKHNNYLFYDKKKNIGYCTGCRNDIKIGNIKNLKHNLFVSCPCCQRRLKAKSLGYSRQNLQDVEWAVVVQKNEDKVIVRYTRHIKKYRDYRNPKTESVELFRTVMDDMSSKAYGLYSDGWANYRKHMGWYISEFSEPIHGAYVYNMDVEKSLDGTYYKHSGVDCVVEHYKDTSKPDFLFTDTHTRLKDAYAIERYFNDYREHPWLEQLVKVGMFRMADDALNYKKYIHVGKSKVNETLGITKGEYKMIAKLENPKLDALEIINIAKKNNFKINEEIFQSLYYWPEYNSFNYENILRLTSYMSFTKAQKMYEKHGSTYSDYIDMAKTLGYDLKNDFVKFPRDVKQAHDNAVNEYNSVKKKHMRLNMRKIIASGIYDFESDKLKIIVPTSSRMITQEGHALHHCVATYIDRVAKGKTMILFVRKKSEPDKSYYTLEFKDGKMAQCRGLKNCDMTPEVKKFVEDFEQHFNNERQKSA